FIRFGTVCNNNVFMAEGKLRHTVRDTIILSFPMNTTIHSKRIYIAFSLVLICIVAGIILYFQNGFISIDGDLTYHLSTAQSFVRDGGMSLTETWDSLPLGRPHLYPPVVHFFLAILVLLKI